MSVYEPADAGFPKYFASMLDDADRNSKYEEATRLCITQFLHEQGRSPHILDLGCGTGMLSAFCLKHGAAHVTALDANKHMVGICRATLAEFGKTKSTIVCGIVRTGRTRGCYIPTQQFDILVSEILGVPTEREIPEPKY